MLTSTLVSSHTEGSGSGVSDSSGADVLGSGADSLTEVLGEGDVSGADSLTEVLGEGGVSGADSLTEVLGEGDVSGWASFRRSRTRPVPRAVPPGL
jgi:hypothetical protein